MKNGGICSSSPTEKGDNIEDLFLGGCEVSVMNDPSVSINRKETMHTDVSGTY
jgi:hypothetical protein